MFRTASTGDTINTRFGRIPLQDTPSQRLFSAGHSRIQVCGQVGRLRAYVETDFLNAPEKQPYRFRQYWGEYRVGKWRILGGRAWSLLRPNRVGIDSEGGLMNSFVVDPGYHVGLAGVRNRQLRITRDDGNWHLAVSYEAGNSFLAKLAHDTQRLHLEVTALGSVHRRAVSMAAVIHGPNKIDIVSQQVISRGVGPELLNTIPANVNAHSTIQGLEARVRPTWRYSHMEASLTVAGPRATALCDSGPPGSSSTCSSSSPGAQPAFRRSSHNWIGPSGRVATAE